MTEITISPTTFYYNSVINSGNKKWTFLLPQTLKHINLLTSSTLCPSFYDFVPAIGTKTILQIYTTLFWLGLLSLNMRSSFLFNRLDRLSLKLYFSCNWSRIWKLFTNFKYPWLNFPFPTLNKFLSFHRSYKVLTPPTTTTE